ncbi:hypothetical protein STEG23_027364, partial [Scotinomys teguina]
PTTGVAPPLSATTNTESIPGIETAEGLHSPRRMVAVKLKSFPYHFFYCRTAHLCYSICRHVFCVLQEFFPAGWRLFSLLLALDSSSSFPCPAFLTIAKSKIGIHLW